MLNQATLFFSSDTIQKLTNKTIEMLQSVPKEMEKGVRQPNNYSKSLIFEEYLVYIEINKTNTVLKITDLKIPKKFHFQEIIYIDFERNHEQIVKAEARYFYENGEKVRFFPLALFKPLEKVMEEVIALNSKHRELKKEVIKKEKINMITNMKEIELLIHDENSGITENITKKLIVLTEFNEKIEKEFKNDMDQGSIEDVNRIYQIDILELVNRYLKLNEKNKEKFEPLLIETLNDMQVRLQQIIDMIEEKYILELEKQCRLITQRYNPKRQNLQTINH